MLRSLAILTAAILLCGVSSASDTVPASTANEGSQVTSQFVPTRSAAFLTSLGIETPQAAVAQQGCCKICTRGKACGNTCISQDKVCHVGRGCACDG
jgi:hypothetical protein